MFNNSFSKNRTVYEIIWKNIVDPDRPQMTIWRKRIARWITKATDAHSEYVYITLTAFPLQQWLHEGASTLPDLLGKHVGTNVCSLLLANTNLHVKMSDPASLLVQR